MFRSRVHVNGKLTLMDYCAGSPDYAGGGFISDSKFSGEVTNGSQQQYIVRDGDLNGWSNGVWNRVLCGDPDAPAQDFGVSGGQLLRSAPEGATSGGLTG